MKNFLEQLKKLKYLLPLVGSFLGTLAGQGFKYLRRVVLPIILSIVGVICLESAWGILLGLIGVFFSMGYGIPEIVDMSEPLIYLDEGSTLGKFWFNSLNYNHHLADIFTRGTIGLGLCLVGLVVLLLFL